MKGLRSALTQLAYENSETRVHLLPLLSKVSSLEDDIAEKEKIISLKKRYIDEIVNYIIKDGQRKKADLLAKGLDYPNMKKYLKSYEDILKKLTGLGFKESGMVMHDRLLYGNALKEPFKSYAQILKIYDTLGEEVVKDGVDYMKMKTMNMKIPSEYWSRTGGSATVTHTIHQIQSDYNLANRRVLSYQKTLQEEEKRLKDLEKELESLKSAGGKTASHKLDDSSLRSGAIRLAYENPALRPHLLPLLK